MTDHEEIDLRKELANVIGWLRGTVDARTAALSLSCLVHAGVHYLLDKPCCEAALQPDMSNRAAVADFLEAQVAPMPGVGADAAFPWETVIGVLVELLLDWLRNR